MTTQGRGLETVENYYDKLASDYDEAVRAWGYCLPETVVEALIKYADLKVGMLTINPLTLVF